MDFVSRGLTKSEKSKTLSTGKVSRTRSHPIVRVGIRMVRERLPMRPEEKTDTMSGSKTVDPVAGSTYWLLPSPMIMARSAWTLASPVPK